MSNSYRNGTYKTKTTIIDNPTFHTPLQVDRVNGVRTYRPYMTTLEALQDKEKKKRRKKIVIVFSLVAILLIIGAVSVALALTVFKTTSKIEDKNVPSAVPSSIPYNLLTASYPDTQEIIVLGEMRLDVGFPRIYSQRADLTRKFIIAVDSLYKDSDVKQYYESATVTQLRPGSVIVFFEMLIKEPVSKSVDARSYEKTMRAIELFKQETLDGQLGEYELFPESVKLFIKTDKDKTQITTPIPVGTVTAPLIEKQEPFSTDTAVRPPPTRYPPRRPAITTDAPMTTSEVTTLQQTTTKQPITTTNQITTENVQTTKAVTTKQPTTISTTKIPTTTQPTTISTTKIPTTVPATTRLTTTETVTTLQTTTMSTTEEPTTTEKPTTTDHVTSDLPTTQTTTVIPTTTVVTTTLETTTIQAIASTQEQLPFQTTVAQTVSSSSGTSTASYTASQAHTLSRLPDVFGDGCESLNCLNGGSCDDSSGFAMCECVDGYFGISCDQNVCDLRTCENGGTCRADGVYNIVCDCPVGFLGSSCEITLSMQPCASNPCQNAGNCTTYNDMYFCDCPYPYGGYNCGANTIGDGGNLNTPAPLCLQVPLDVCRQHVPYNTSGLSHPYRVVDSPEEASEKIMHYRNVLQACDENIDRLVCLIFSPECPLESGFPRSACSGYCIDVLQVCMNSIDPLTQDIYEAIMTLYQICMELPNAEELCIGPQNNTRAGDPCSSNPCLNGASCTPHGAEGYAYYMCECPDGYIGEICDVEFGFTPSICTASTCLNGGTCEEDDYLPKCICPEGFIGQQCEAVDNGGQDSIHDEDMYGSICTDVMSSCIKVLPYNLTYHTMDLDQSSQDAMTSVDDQFQRSVSTCDHPDVERFLCSVLNPECVPSNALIGAPRTACRSLCNQIRVSCPDALPMNASTFEQYCDHMIESSDIAICIPPSSPLNASEADHVCSNVTCRNDGICFEFEGNPLCKCREGFSGSMCQLEYTDPCLSTPCQNQGLCITDVINFYVSYACECIDGFYGTHCEESICDDLPCSNGGTCRPSGIYTTECICPEGYAGSFCEINLYPADPCQSNPCLNEGSCQSQITGLYSSYYCICHPGFYGRNCEHGNPCIPNPCQYSGHCTHNETGSFTCSCAQGHGGVLCETVLDLCISNPCLNGGLCSSDGVRYSCSCTLEYDGENCQEDVVDQLDQTT